MEQLQEKKESPTLVYVANLPFSTTDEELEQVFSEFKPKNAYVAKRYGIRSKGFGFVNLADHENQQKAIEALNGAEVDGRRITVRVAYEDHRRNDRGELKEEYKKQLEAQSPMSDTIVFVGNLPWSVDDKTLAGLFSGFNVVSAEVAKRRNGKSKGFGLVTLSSNEEQKKAIEAVHLTEVEGRKAVVRPAIEGGPKKRPRKQTAKRATSSSKSSAPAASSNALFVGNLPFEFEDSDLEQVFGEFNFTSAKIAKSSTGRSRGYGVVEFANQQNLQKALDLDQASVNDRIITVKPYVPRSRAPRQRRKTPIRRKKPVRVGRRSQKARAPVDAKNSVYITNLPFEIEDEDLKEIFGDFNVVSSTVAKRRNGRSKGYGFVQLASAEEQQRALQLDQATVNDRVITVKISTGPRARSARPPRRQRKDRQPSSTRLYIANLPFSVDDNGLRSLFAGFDVVSAEVATSKTGRNKGFGFVELGSSEQQQEALKKLDQTELSGRTLSVQVALVPQAKTDL